MNGADGAGRHERARAVDVADRLRERLGHVGAGMERQLQQAGVLDRLRLDALDAVDVEEVVLVVVDEIPLHLRRAHAAVRLRDVDDRQIQIGKDVDAHPADGEDRRSARRAITATSIVIGRRSAARISHMSRRSLGLPHERDERRQVALRDRRLRAARARRRRARADPATSACASRLCASATSTMLARPAL